MDRERLDAAVARTTALGRRLDRMERLDAARRLGRADADWDESKHKRGQPGNAGQFGSGGGGAAKKEPAAKSEGGGGEKPAAMSAEAKAEKVGKVTGKKKGKHDDFDAAAYAKSQDDPDVTPEKIMEKLTPAQRAEIEDVHRRIAERGQTIEKHRNENGEYNKERAAVHDMILYEGRTGRDPETGGKKWYDGILSPEAVKRATPKPGEKPTFTMLGGRGGSGKSQFNGEVYDEDSAIVLDADHIKHMIEEFEGWNANEVHEESSDILETGLRIAREHGLNLVFDATMKSSGGALEKVKAFKEAGYRIEAHYMHLPRQIAAERTINRYFSPGKKADPALRGRYAPAHVVLANRLNESNFNEVRQHADKWSFHDNNVARGEKAKMVARGGYDDDDED